jgi:Secretion system C-terminal sorting domain
MKKSTVFNFKSLILATCMMLTVQSSNAQTQKGADIDGEAAGDQSGYSVSMPDANTMAIGAINNSEKALYAGHVRIYSWNGSAWTQKGADIDGEAAGDRSGYSVSMPDANTVAIGAFLNDGKATNAGHVRIYSWSGSAWMQKGTDIDGEAADDQSGYSISMPDANTVAIGADRNDGKATFAGHVRIYSWNGSAWTQKGADIDGEAANDQSGNFVSMPDANTLAIGAWGNDGKATNAGHVRIYSWNGSAWTQKGADIDGEAAGDVSGYSVSMPDANTVAIGAIYNSEKASFAGHVRIYSWSGSTWTQKGADIDGEATNDFLGYSVSMPDDNTVAIGALYNSEKASFAGHVRIYSWNGSTWTQKGVDIDGESTNDFSGHSVSMPDASTVAIGAYGNSEKASKAGHVRVYQLCENTSETIATTACNRYVSPSKKYTYTKSDTYYDTIPNATGCDSIITINLTINSNDVSVTNSSPTLTANATGATYQWLDCNKNFTKINNAKSRTYVANSNGTYAVEVTQNGCIDTSLCINLSNVQILENTFSTSVKLFPNPTNDEVTIDLGKHYNEVSVIIRNALGQEVMKESFNNTNAFKLNISGETGLYILELHATGHKALLRVLKNTKEPK